MRVKIITLIMAVMLAGSYTAPPARVNTAPKVAPTYIVKTDYSGLTPYSTKPELYTRLTPEPMPKLVPSDSYGPLVPYAGARVFNEYGYSHITYGLMALGGTIVTDAIYSEVWLDSSPDRKNSVYYLKDSRGTNPREGEHTFASVCAIDGSWSLPFDYALISLCDSVIMAYHGFEYSDGGGEYYDADVYDYSGRLLYSTLDLPCADTLEINSGWSGMTLSRVSGDYAVATLTTGVCVYIHLPTGEVTYTDYDEARPFSDGMSAVRVGNLWGYVDDELRVAISPQYTSAGDFHDGQAVVVPSGKIHNYVIKKSGIVLSAEEYSTIPAKIDGNTVRLSGDGWYYYDYPGGAMLVLPDGTQCDIPGATYIRGVYGELVLYDGGGDGYGVITTSGEGVIPLSAGHTYMYKSRSLDLFLAWSRDGITAYKLDGSVFRRVVSADFAISDSEMESQHSADFLDSGYGLLGIIERDSFYYLDESGDVVFRVSMLGHVPD